MTDKDKELIKRANELSDIQWSIAYDLADEAESNEAKEELTIIAKRLFHTEEASCGCI